MRFLNLAEMKATWTWQICFPTVEKNHRSNKTRLRQAVKFVEFCGRQERISKKQDGSLIGRIPTFRGEYSQLFIHKLCAFLGYSNHKPFFLFKAFASITSAPPLRKILAAPLHAHTVFHSLGSNLYWLTPKKAIIAYKTMLNYKMY